MQANAEDGPRGRVSTRDLHAGDTYYAVYSPTGVCLLKTRSRAQAEEVAARNPDRREVCAHVIKGATVRAVTVDPEG
jgi:hypothetical protein